MTARRLPRHASGPMPSSVLEPHDLPCVQDVTRRLAVRETTGAYPASAFDVLIAGVAGGRSAGWRFDQAVIEAREMCAQCPDRAGCLSRNQDEEWVETLAEHRVRDKSVIRDNCGTEAGYSKHRHENEHPCADCRRAASEKSAKRKKRRKVPA